jgi:hypothetical protein
MDNEDVIFKVGNAKFVREEIDADYQVYGLPIDGMRLFVDGEEVDEPFLFLVDCLIPEELHPPHNDLASNSIDFVSELTLPALNVEEVLDRIEELIKLDDPRMQGISVWLTDISSQDDHGELLELLKPGARSMWDTVHPNVVHGVLGEPIDVPRLREVYVYLMTETAEGYDG